MLRFAGAVVVSLLTLAASAPAQGTDPCRAPAGASVLAKRSGSVVYATRLSVSACHRGRRPVKLAEISPAGAMDYTRVERVAVRSRYAAVLTRSVDHYGCVQLSVASADLRTRKLHVQEAVGSSIDCQAPVDTLRSEALVLGNRGSVALTRWNADHSEVVRVPRGKRPQVIDPGPGVIGTSLRLRGTKLEWTTDGGAMSASLR
jgi:hypothetical protein